MTKQDWMNAVDPTSMLEFLRDGGSASDRKFRLFASACCRHIWACLPGSDSERAVEVAERQADSQATQDEVEQARSESFDLAEAADWSVANEIGPPDEMAHAIHAVSHLFSVADGESYFCRVAREALEAARCVGYERAYEAADEAKAAAEDPEKGEETALDVLGAVQEQADEAERACQADLLRDLFGLLPFRTPSISASWRTPAVLSLAQVAYEERVALDPVCPGWLVLDPTRLLVLADALEDAGADEPEMLEHLRRPGEHVRGCWCLDLLLDVEEGGCS